MDNKVHFIAVLLSLWTAFSINTYANNTFTCGALVCNNQVNAAIDAGCRGFISIDGMLESPCSGTGVQYQLEVKADKNKTFRTTVNASSQSGLGQGITIDPDFISCGKTYTVKVSRTENGRSKRSCSTRVKFEDHTPPTIRPFTQTIIACEDISKDALLEQIQFSITDFCSSKITDIRLGRFPNNFCSGTATVPVTVEAVDFCGNKAKNHFDIRVTRPTSLIAPKDTILDCGSGTHPDLAGYPSLDIDGDGEGDSPIIETACSFSANYTDVTYAGCGNGVKIHRTWLVYDWCRSTSAIMTYRQFIHVKDKEAPELKCPKDNEVGGKNNPKSIVANGANCSATLLGLLPSVEDDCSGTIKPTLYKIANRTNSSVTYNISDPHLPTGKYYVEYRAEDACGNRSPLCKYYFDVKPGGTPIAICKDQLNIGLTNSEAIIRAKDLDEGSYDNCSSISLTIKKEGNNSWANSVSYTCSDAIADKKLYLRVVNAAGKSNTCWLTIRATNGGRPCNSSNSQEEEEEEEEEVITVTEEEGEEENTEEVTTVTEEEEENKETAEEENSSTSTNTHASLKGKIITPMELPVSQVAIDIHNEQGVQASDMSDASGEFELTLATNKTYQLALDKNSDKSNGVSIIDMVLILRHILGLDEFHATHQYIAADVNGSGQVTTYDAVELRHMILGGKETTEIPAWRFADRNTLAQQILPQMKEEMVIDMLSADKEMTIMAIKVGDVSGNADPSNLVTSQPRNKQNIHLLVENQYLTKGATISVPIRFSNTNQLLGLQMALTTQASTIRSIQKGALATHQYRQSHPQKVAIAWDALSTPTTGDLFFEMTIQAEENGWLKDMIHIEEKQLSPLAYTATEEAHAVALQFSDTPPMPISLSSSPNPFQNETTISFYLPRAEATILSLFDINGTLLNRYIIEGHQGLNEFILAGEVLPNNSTILYQLQTSEGVFTNKLIRAF